MGCYVVEVPSAGALKAEKHMYEEIFLVVEGRGTTEVWLEGDRKKTRLRVAERIDVLDPDDAWHRLVNATSGGALLLGRHHRAQRVRTRLRAVDHVEDGVVPARSRAPPEVAFTRRASVHRDREHRSFCHSKTCFLRSPSSHTSAFRAP